MRPIKLNKKAQFETRLLAIVLIFIVGIILFFLNHFNQQIYENLESTLNESKYTDTEAVQTATSLKDIEETSIWDYAFLAIFIGFLIQIVLFSFATRISIAFYWILILLDLPILIVAVIVSNVWQELANNAEFVTTLTRFPITNAILGSYFPMVAVIVFFFASVIMFGKKPGAE